MVEYPVNKGDEYTVPILTIKLGECIFEDCHLTKLTASQVSPTCHEGAFKGVGIVGLFLVVPKGLHESYWMHPIFGKLDLEEMD